MLINAQLRSKQEEIQPVRCDVACIVELSNAEFFDFQFNPLADHDFIKEHAFQFADSSQADMNAFFFELDLFKKRWLEKTRSEQMHEMIDICTDNLREDLRKSFCESFIVDDAE